MVTLASRKPGEDCGRSAASSGHTALSSTGGGPWPPARARQLMSGYCTTPHTAATYTDPDTPGYPPPHQHAATFSCWTFYFIGDLGSGFFPMLQILDILNRYVRVPIP